jgi:hypothetical protein
LQNREDDAKQYSGPKAIDHKSTYNFGAKNNEQGIDDQQKQTQRKDGDWQRKQDKQGF